MSTSFGASKGRAGEKPYPSPKQVGPNQDSIKKTLLLESHNKQLNSKQS